MSFVMLRLDVWSRDVDLGQIPIVEYRYFKAKETCEFESTLPGGNFIVTEWEANVKPRLYKPSGSIFCIFVNVNMLKPWHIFYFSALV